MSPRKAPIDAGPGAPSPDFRGDQAWEDVKRRLPIGHVVFGEVLSIEPYGTFFDIGNECVAFVDSLDLTGIKLEIGAGHCLKVLQHADWNQQIRAALADEATLKSNGLKS